jgi:dipeptidyl aminopeptidase/acylaminoacyl peptidase
MRTRPLAFVAAVALLPLAALAQAASPATPPPAAAAPAASAPALVAPDVPAGADAARDAELARAAAPFVDAFLVTDARFTRDGKGVAFVSNEHGLPQLYLADAAKPAGPARRLVTSTERVVLDALTPDGRAVLFRSDRGADENWSVFRVGLDGQGPVELTPGAKMQRDAVFVADLAPGTIWFSGRKMEEASSAVFAAPADAPGPAREVYRDAKPGFLTDVSRDGKRALFLRYPTASENYVVSLDLATGEATTIYPKAGKVAVHDAKLSPDGKIAYVATDGGGEQAWLLALDARTGAELGRYVEKELPVASVASLAVAKAGGAIGLSLDAGNRSVIRILDARGLRVRSTPTLPLGQGVGTEFSEDGRRLAAIWSTPTAPNDAFAVDARTGSVAKLRAAPRPALAAAPVDVEIVTVKARDGLSLPVNVYLPRRRAGRLPVIVSYHGGPAGSSRIRWAPYAAFFLAQGYAWVEPNVRGSGGFGRAFEEADNGTKRLDAFGDIEVTGRWAASQPWADPQRVVVFGGSYGGYTVLVGLTRMPALWRAGVDLFGVANLATFMATTSGLIREIFLLEFGDPAKDAAFLASISPLEEVDRIVDPLFVYAGANDPRVPRSESDLIVRALRERKVPVEYMVAGDEGHSLSRSANMIEFLARSARFLERHAGPAPKPREAAPE